MNTIKNLTLTAVAAAFFAAINVHAYFDPSVGRWASRDPVGELAFTTGHSLNSEARFQQLQKEALLPSYVFVRNSPISNIDFWGLYANCCCDATTINNNKQQLIDRYSDAASYIDPSRPWPILPEEGSWSCLNVSRNVGHFMEPIPPCWTCYVENRRAQIKWYPFGGYQSHDLNAVVCVSHPISGNPQKIVFDYWHNAPAAEDYNTFANNYPYTSGVDMNFTGTDCSQPQKPWSAKNDYLNLISGGPPTPPAPMPPVP